VGLSIHLQYFPGEFMFEKEYDIKSIQKITPRGQNFSMYITPRFRSHFLENEFEKITAKIISTYINENCIFVDIGAHYGFYSLLVGKKSKVTKIISFEPVPQNFEILKRNIQLNNIQNIELRNEAISDIVGQENFVITEASDNCGFHGHLLSKARETISVKTLTLDAALTDDLENEIFIKIDVEGHEIHVLRGMQNLIKKALPQIRLIVEYNPKLLRYAGYEPISIIEELFLAGFQVFLIDEDNERIQAIRRNDPDYNDILSKLEKSDRYANLFCVPIEHSLSILFFSHSSDVAGAERSLLSMISSLIKKGIICTVVVPSEGKLNEYLEESGAFVIKCPYEWWAHPNKLNLEQINKKLVDNFELIYYDLLPKLRSVNPDIVVTNTSVIPWGAISAYFLDRPHIWYIREFQILDYGLNFIFPEQRIAEYIRSSSSKVLCNSKAVKKHYFGEEVDPNIEVIYPQIDFRSTGSQQDNRNYFEDKNATHILIVGTIAEGKGQLEAIQAVQRLLQLHMPVELVIMGYRDPNYANTILEYIESNKLQNQVHLLDYQSNPKPVYEQSDIVLVCSRNEAFGRVTIEAMSLGKPVIATRTGGALEIIEDGVSGLLYQPGDINELTEKIIFLIYNPHKSLELGKNAIKRANYFLTLNSGERIYKNLFELKHKKNSSQGAFIRWVVNLCCQEMEAQQAKLAEKEHQNTQLKNELLETMTGLQEAQKTLIFSKELVQEFIRILQMVFTQLHAQNQYLLEYKLVKELLNSAQKISNLNYRLPLFYLCVNLLQRLGEKESKDKLIKDIKQIGLVNTNNKIGASIRKYLNEVDLKEQAYLSAQNNFDQIIQATDALDILDEIEHRKEIFTSEFIDVIYQQAIRANANGDEELSQELLGFADIVTKMTETFKQSEQTYHLTHPTENDYFSLLLEALFINAEIENKSKPISIEAVKPPRKRQRHLEPIDIIICVHNALEDVERCLLSITKHTVEPYNLIIVDDGSDQSTREFLVEFTGKVKNSLLIRNENARGYTRAANQAMQKSKSNILVLLNSDTIVGPDWLDGLYSVLKADEKIGVVGPLSNTASWQSIPKLTESGDWAMNPLPDGLSVDEMSDLVRKYAAGLELYVPLLNGFCLMIRREVINQIGYFNEEIFGDGYGEEDDFNLRAQKAGWKLAIADDVYIFHAQSKSYSTERRRQLAQRAGIKLRELHGDDLVNFSVNCMNPNRVLEGIRARTNMMLEIEQLLQIGREKFSGKKVLFILPVLTVGGGANVVIDEACCMRKMEVDARIFNINSYKEGFLRAYPHLDIPVVFGDQKDLINIAPLYDAVIATANFSVEWLKPLEGYAKPILGYYIQGFEPWMYDINSPEFTKALESYTIIENIIAFTKTNWTQQTVYKYTRLKPAIVGISININLFRPRDTRIFGEKPIKIVAMIRAESKYRKPEFTMEMLRRLKKEYKESVLIQLFGTQDIRYSNLAVPLDFDYEQYGILTQLQVANLLSKADIFVDFSEHQAMGLTALEAMACGCAVIVPQNGGAIEFVQDRKNGLIVDTNNSAACYNALQQIVENDLLRREIQISALHDVVKYFPEKPAFNILNCLFTEHKSASQKFVNKKRKK